MGEVAAMGQARDMRSLLSICALGTIVLALGCGTGAAAPRVVTVSGQSVAPPADLPALANDVRAHGGVVREITVTDPPVNVDPVRTSTVYGDVVLAYPQAHASATVIDALGSAFAAHMLVLVGLAGPVVAQTPSGAPASDVVVETNGFDWTLARAPTAGTWVVFAYPRGDGMLDVFRIESVDAAGHVEGRGTRSGASSTLDALRAM
jgi:hypothetical protein